MKKIVVIQKPLKIFERAATSGILICLYKNNKPLMLKEINEIIDASTATVWTRLNDLVKAGLLKEKKEVDFPWTRWISLTVRGRAVAQLLIGIEKIMAVNDEDLERFLEDSRLVEEYTQSIVFVPDGD